MKKERKTGKQEESWGLAEKEFGKQKKAKETERKKRGCEKSLGRLGKGKMRVLGGGKKGENQKEKLEAGEEKGKKKLENERIEREGRS